MNQQLHRAPVVTPRPRGRPRSFECEQVLDAAIPIFWERGYDGASLDDLTKAMGIGRPSLYAAFGDKRGLFLRVLERYGETRGRCGMVALADEDVTAAVTGFFERTLAGQTCKDGPSGCLIGSSVGAALGAVEGVDEIVRGMDRATECVLSDRFKAAIEAEQLPPDFPVRERARLVCDLMHAQAHRARAGERADELLAEIPSKVDAVLRQVAG